MYGSETHTRCAEPGTLCVCVVGYPAVCCNKLTRGSDVLWSLKTIVLDTTHAQERGQTMKPTVWFL